MTNAKQNSRQQVEFIRGKYPNVDQNYMGMFNTNQRAREENQEPSYIYLS